MNINSPFFLNTSSIQRWRYTERATIVLRQLTGTHNLSAAIVVDPIGAEREASVRRIGRHLGLHLRCMGFTLFRH